MSRGPAQPGRWRREVRASGRSLPGSRRSHPLLPLGGEGLSSAGRGRAGAAESQGQEQHFGLGGGRGGQKKGVERETRSPNLEFRERGKESGRRGKEKAGGETRKGRWGSWRIRETAWRTSCKRHWQCELEAGRTLEEPSRRARTRLSAVLGSRRGWESALFPGPGGAGTWAPAPGWGRTDRALVRAGGCSGAAGRRLPPGRERETSARAREEDRGRPSARGRGEERGDGDPTRQGRGPAAVSLVWLRRRVYDPLLTSLLPQSSWLLLNSRPPLGSASSWRVPPGVPCSHTLQSSPSSGALTPECPARLSCSAAPHSHGDTGGIVYHPIPALPSGGSPALGSQPPCLSQKLSQCLPLCLACAFDLIGGNPSFPPPLW